MSSRRFTRIVTAVSLFVVGLGQMPLATAAAAGGNTAAPDFSAALQARAMAQVNANALRAQLREMTGNRASGNVQPAEQFKNIDRAYPASCLGSPIQLGLWANDPNLVQKQVTLYGDPLGNAAEKAFHEVDTVSVFRVPCSGGKSAVLVEIDRPSTHDTTNYPVFPDVTATTTGNVAIAIRLADDPNTFYTNTYSFTPVVNSDVFVVENFYNPSVAVTTQTFDFTQAFNIVVDNLNANDPNRVTSFPLGAYSAANYGNYPNISNPMEITGYMSTNWTSPTQGGEGIVMQVYDNNDSATRTLAFAWFTFDANKRPFWLFGQALVPNGTTTISAQTVYYNNGTFGGSSTVGLPAVGVGVVTFRFPDCGHMNVAYNIDASAFQGPKGQGSSTYLRVADVNGLVCQ